MKKYHFVYITTNLINKKQYVGDHSTENLNCSKTLNYLGSGKLTLHPAIKKYGKENFKREILEFFDTKQEAFDAQEKYIRLYETHVSQWGYNISWTGGTECSGGSVSKESREKMSKSRKGKEFSEEHKENLRKSHIGLKQSDETIEKRISKTRGMKRSEETRQKMRKPNTKEHNKKISESRLGVKHSKEGKQNQSKAAKKRWENLEERKKQGERTKGRKHSKETILKISKATKGIPKEKIECPHCGKTGGKPQMYQWHFNNCKFSS